jgi:hypothetical protein
VIAAEREHIIRWSDDAEEPLSIYTHRRAVAEKLLKAGARLRWTNKTQGKTSAWQLECPREWIRWPIPRKRRQIPQADRAALGARLKAAREKKDSE